jgi:DNA polymerase III epsilon subunit-like protein
MYKICLDTETHGFPVRIDGKFPEYKELKSYDFSRLLQVSWILTIGNVIHFEKNYYVKIDKSMKIENSHIHGITNEICEQKGIDISLILKDLFNDLKKCKMFIGYNIDFDVNIIKSEYYRYSLENKDNLLVEGKENSNDNDLIKCLDQIEKFDVMKNGVIMYQLEKYLKLGILYQKLFNIEMSNAHNSMFDVYATFRCFIKMVYNENNIYIKNV